jgi:hypothetical protein
MSSRDSEVELEVDEYDTEVELDDALDLGADLDTNLDVGSDADMDLGADIDLEEELELDADMALEPASIDASSELTDVGDTGGEATDDLELFEAPGVDLSGDDSKED